MREYDDDDDDDDDDDSGGVEKWHLGWNGLFCAQLLWAIWSIKAFIFWYLGTLLHLRSLLFGWAILLVETQFCCVSKLSAIVEELVSSYIDVIKCTSGIYIPYVFYTDGIYVMCYLVSH